MFYIINNGGDIRYPPEGLSNPEPDEYSQNIDELLNEGFHFHYDGGRNHVICFFKGRVNTDSNSDQLISNQFYAIYYGDGTEGDLLGHFKEKVESAFDSQGWRTSESGQSIDSIYTDLTSVDPIDPAIDASQLDAALTGSQDAPVPIQLGAPDYTSALGVCKRLVDEYTDIRVTICSSATTEGFPESNVVIIPNQTDEPGAPTNETKEYIDEKSYENQVKNTRRAVKDFIETSEDESDDGERALVEALEAGFRETTLSSPSEFGVHIDTPERKTRVHSGIGNIAASLGGMAGILLALGAARYYGLLGNVIEVLSSIVYIKEGLLPPSVVPVEPIPIRSFSIIGMSLVFLLLSVVVEVERGFSVGEAAVQRVRPASNARQTEGVANESATEDTKAILEQLNELERHPNLGEAAGDGEAIESVFSPFESIVVDDWQTYRLGKLKTALLSFGKGIVAAALLVSIFALLGVVASEFWAWFLQGIFALSATLFAWKVGPVVLSGARAFADLATATEASQDTPFNYRTVMHAGIMIFAAWSTTHLAGSLTWAENDGVTYHLTTGVVTETLGRVVTTSIAVEIGFFAAVSFVVGVLVVDYLERSQNYENSVILLSFCTSGLITLWASSWAVLVSNVMWIPGVVTGGVAAIVLGSDRSPISLERPTEYLSYPIGAFIVISFIEGMVRYRSPIKYEIASAQFVLRSFEFSGYAYAVNAGGLALSLGHVAATAGAIYVLAGIVKTKRDFEVLVIGPPGSSPAYHVSLLFHALHTERGVRTTPDEKVRTLQQKNTEISNGIEPEELLEFTGLESEKLTVKPSDTTEITVWAPLPGSAFFEDRVFEKLDHVEDLVRPQNLPEAGYDTLGEQAYLDLATSFVSADAVILLFPVENTFNESDQLQESSVNSVSDTPEHPIYLRYYRTLLNKHRTGGQVVLGAIPNPGKILQQKSDLSRLEDVNEAATNRIFEDYDSEARYEILNSVANGHDDSLPAVAKLKDHETIGVAEELDDLSEALDTEL